MQTLSTRFGCSTAAALLGIPSWDRGTGIAVPFRQPGMMNVRPLVRSWAAQKNTSLDVQHIDDSEQYEAAVEALFAELCSLRGLARPGSTDAFEWPEGLHHKVHHPATLVEAAFELQTSGGSKLTLPRVLELFLNADRHPIPAMRNNVRMQEIPGDIEPNISTRSQQLAQVLGQYIERTIARAR